MEEKKVTFEDIKKANETIKTTPIKGKEYAEVNQRIKAFRMVYPTGTLNTEMVSNVNGICVFRAYVYDGDRLLATGTAYEKETSTFINKTSYIENCETSALGRALGIAGFGIDTSVASAEEMQNALNNQDNPGDNKLELLTEFNELVDETNQDLNKILNYYKVKSNTEMTPSQLRNAIKELTRIKAERGE